MKQDRIELSLSTKHTRKCKFLDNVTCLNPPSEREYRLAAHGNLSCHREHQRAVSRKTPQFPSITIMFEQLVVKGSPTTTGGYVASGSSTHYDERGNTMARDGDQATCGNCKGLFPIRGSASTWLDDGKAMVKDLDWVLCPCRQNRVRASPSTTFYYSTDGGGRAATRTAEQSIVEIARTVVHDEQYTLRDQSGRALQNVRYRVVTDTGQEFTGITDAHGQTNRIRTGSAASLQIYTKEN
ncbi:PAAR domain-containing protein [Burkholderia vietnamiensis]|uniref:PAAR domain-containing protein n=1 Tax=Burkholderia vietnamiensis TaxID=60552 RepID=UPI001594756C|nr:PAAR domain-containing protein [Burkholderia vietnamiensis]HDR9218703.1 PAAR domain-containing protein [Burkholderia vietnamiensis]